MSPDYRIRNIDGQGLKYVTGVQLRRKLIDGNIFMQVQLGHTLDILLGGSDTHGKCYDQLLVDLTLAIG